MFSVFRLHRSLSVIARSGSISYTSIRLQDRAAFILPGYRIGVRCLSIGCSIDSIACHICNCRSPVIEGIGILRCSCLCGRSRLSDVRCQRPVVVLRLRQNSSVFILKGDSILIGCAVIRSPVRRICCHINNRRVPSGEGIRILRRSFLGRSSGLCNIFGLRAIIVLSRFLQNSRSVLIHKRHAVLNRSPHSIKRDVFVNGSIEVIVVSVQLPLNEGIVILCRIRRLSGLRTLVDGLRGYRGTSVRVEDYRNRGRGRSRSCRWFVCSCRSSSWNT